jgi:glycosyltransferase involved in cell wall biosynthesis
LTVEIHQAIHDRACDGAKSMKHGRTAERQRILLSVHSATAGGAELMALAEAAHLQRAFDLVISIPDGPLRRSFAAHGELIDGTASMPLWGDSAKRWLGRSAHTVRQAKELARLIRRRNVDLVLTNSAVSLAPVMASRIASVPVIVHARDVPGSKLAPFLFGLHGVLAQTVIIISDELKPYFSVRRSTRVVKIADGVDLPRFDDEGQLGRRLAPLGRPVRLCLIGGVTRRKGQDLAVRALSALRDAGVEAVLEFVGREIEPAFAASVRELARINGVAAQIRFLGELDGVAEHLRDIDIVLVPSRGEWTPLVIMEALAHQKPVVAADVGSIASIIRDGETGVLVPPNDPHRLATAIARLRADPEAAALMGYRGRQLIERNFSIAVMLTRLDREIHRLLAAQAA